MLRRGCHEERRGYGGTQERHEEDPGLQIVQLWKALGKRYREQEGKEELHAGKDYTQLVQ